MIRRERYFTERLFWMPDTDGLLHVFFVHGSGWMATETFGNARFAIGVLRKQTYTEMMQEFNHRQPELLLQETL